MFERFKLKINYIHLFNWEDDEQSSCVMVNNNIMHNVMT